MENVSGNCLCGAVTVTLEEPKSEVSACHCHMCQRWGGIALLGISGTSFTIGGKENISVYKSSDWAERAFCATCGSNLYFRYLPGDHYSFIAGLFEKLDGFRMSEQIFIDEKPAYYSFAENTPKLTGAETMEKYGVGN